MGTCRSASWVCRRKAKSFIYGKLGLVTVFRPVDKHGTARHYAQSDPQKKRRKIAFGHFKHARSLPWKIECYHHALKEVCHVRRFFVRWKQAISNHVFCSLRAFLRLEAKRAAGQISSWYQFKRRFADQALTTFIQKMVKQPHGA